MASIGVDPPSVPSDRFDIALVFFDRYELLWIHNNHVYVFEPLHEHKANSFLQDPYAQRRRCAIIWKNDSHVTRGKMTEADGAPLYVILIRSPDVQIYPPPGHRCDVGPTTGPCTVAWFSTIGNYLVWACPRCDHLTLFSCDVLVQNAARRATIIEGVETPMFMGFSAWKQRTEASWTRDEIIQLLQQSHDAY